MKSCIVALVLLASSCCAATAQAVSYCDLVKAPQQFAGKRIRVRAIYKYGFEIQRLDSPACCPERGVKIGVEIETGLEGDSLKFYHKFPKGMGPALATFEGTFESSGPYGDGGYRFKFTVDKIEKLEAVAKPSTDHHPAWVPKDCETSNAPQGRGARNRAAAATTEVSGFYCASQARDANASDEPSENQHAAGIP
jgi:hypothetical protein